MASAFTISGKVELDTSSFTQAINKVDDGANKLKDKLNQATNGKIEPQFDGKGIEEGISAVDGLGSALAGLSGILILKKAGDIIVDSAKKALAYNAKMEMYETNYTTMLGDEAKAQAHVNDLREKASKTPFSMDDLASASKTLLSFGADSETIMDKIQMLGDISLGDSNKLQSLTLAFAQMSSVGKLMGQDLLQMINAGFNPLQVISEKTGASIGDLKEAMGGGKGSKEFRAKVAEARKEVKKLGDNASDGAKMLAEIGTTGQISSEMVEQAFVAASSEGGRFYKGMETASATFNGRMATLSDNFSQLLGNVFSPLNEVIADGILPAANSLVLMVNSLFTDKKSTFTVEGKAEVDEAMTTLAGLDDKVQRMRNDYTMNQIEANVKLANAQSLAEELRTIFEENAGTKMKNWTEEDLSRAKEITSALVAIYPELSKYVGSNGILDAEKTSVQELTLEYNKLEKAKHASEYLAGLQALQADAELQVEVLNAKREQYVQEQNQHDMYADAYAVMHWAAAQAQMTGIGRVFQNGEYIANQENLNNAMEVLKAYQELSGGSMQEAVDYAAQNGIDGLNIASLFDESGNLRTGTDILAQAGGEESLMALVTALAGLSAEKSQQEAIAAESYGEVLREIDKSTADAETSLQKTKEDVALAEKVKQNIESREAVETIGETVEELTGEAQTVEMEADTEQAMSNLGEVGKKLAEITGDHFVSIYAQYRGFDGDGTYVPKYATGLDYVPYDNYMAQLHQGEAVLTKAEANMWRKEGTGFAVRGMESVTVPITINGNVDDPFAFADRVRDAFETARWMA